MGTSGGTSGGTSYTVTFKTNGGSAVVSQTVAAGETAKEPEDPKKDGYKFGGWYADSELTSLFSFATKIVKDTTLYAKWIDDSVPTYKVAVNPITNGTVTVTPLAGVAEGAEVTLEIKPDPGYALDTLTVDGADKTADVAAGKYTFKMTGHDVMVSAAFKFIYSTGLVGDIVLSDGKYITAENYTKYKSIVDASNETAIAVIFYVGTGLNSGDDTTTSRTLGVGLDNTGLLEWCTDSANADGISITTILCHSNTSANIVNSNMTFTGDRNGSDNLKQISGFLKANSLTDDTTETEAKYPAFYFAENYKEHKIGDETASRIPAGSEYESGWDMPGLAEIRQIWERKATVDAAIALCGASPFGDKWYWTSSQHPTVANKACTFCFQTGQWGEPPKSGHTDHVCVVREFN